MGEVGSGGDCVVVIDQAGMVALRPWNLASHVQFGPPVLIYHRGRLFSCNLNVKKGDGEGENCDDDGGFDGGNGWKETGMEGRKEAEGVCVVALFGLMILDLESYSGWS